MKVLQLKAEVAKVIMVFDQEIVTPRPVIYEWLYPIPLDGRWLKALGFEVALDAICHKELPLTLSGHEGVFTINDEVVVKHVHELQRYTMNKEGDSLLSYLLT